MAVGSSVREVKPGDLVRLRIENFEVHQYRGDGFEGNVENMKNRLVKYKIPTAKVGDKEFISCDERDIEYIIEEAE